MLYGDALDVSALLFHFPEQCCCFTGAHRLIRARRRDALLNECALSAGGHAGQRCGERFNLSLNVNGFRYVALMLVRDKGGEDFGCEFFCGARLQVVEREPGEVFEGFVVQLEVVDFSFHGSKCVRELLLVVGGDFFGSVDEAVQHVGCVTAAHFSDSAVGEHFLCVLNPERAGTPQVSAAGALFVPHARVGLLLGACRCGASESNGRRVCGFVVGFFEREPVFEDCCGHHVHADSGLHVAGRIRDEVDAVKDCGDVSESGGFAHFHCKEDCARVVAVSGG